MAVCAQSLAGCPWTELGWACLAPSASPKLLMSWSSALGLTGRLLSDFRVLQTL